MTPSRIGNEGGRHCAGSVGRGRGGQQRGGGKDISVSGRSNEAQSISTKRKNRERKKNHQVLPEGIRKLGGLFLQRAAAVTWGRLSNLYPLEKIQRGRVETFGRGTRKRKTVSHVIGSRGQRRKGSVGALTSERRRERLGGREKY